ncbi:MAG TPA: DUF3021 family protein [Lachnospiraceae bacterium]|nr:DUF3021 family protein [Lachnospiraceae bacterium]
MWLEEILKKMAISFFIIVTGVVGAIYIFCLIFSPDAVFSLTDIGRIFLMAAAGDLPLMIFLSGTELTKKQMVLRKSIHFIVLSGILLYLAIRWDWVDPKSIKEVAVFLLTVLLVYVVVFFVSGYRDKKLTYKLNERLREKYRS